jgi:hypothetical protein
MAGTGTNRAERACADRRKDRPEQRFRVRTVSVAFPVSNDGSRLVPPPNARSAPIAPARSRCGSHSYPARRQARIPNDINLLQKGLRLRAAAHTSPSHLDAGWSSPVARQAHNLKVVSSNLAPATKIPKLIQQLMQSPAWLSPAGLLLVSAPCPFLGPSRNTNAPHCSMRDNRFEH